MTSPRNKPRRASVARWLQDAPPFVLDCFDHPAAVDRYTVFLGGEHIAEWRGKWWVSYLGMSDAPTLPHGFSQWGEITQSDAARYRYVNGRHRVRWLDLPEHIRDHVIARANEGNDA